ncbi:unnamed protein product, partial [Rotaria sordida]
RRSLISSILLYLLIPLTNLLLILLGQKDFNYYPHNVCLLNLTSIAYT